MPALHLVHQLFITDTVYELIESLDVYLFLIQQKGVIALPFLKASELACSPII